VLIHFAALHARVATIVWAGHLNLSACVRLVVGNITTQKQRAAAVGALHGPQRTGRSVRVRITATEEHVTRRRALALHIAARQQLEGTRSLVRRRVSQRECSWTAVRVSSPRLVAASCGCCGAIAAVQRTQAEAAAHAQVADDITHNERGRKERVGRGAAGMTQ
jgi:hypothetical protein